MPLLGFFENFVDGDMSQTCIGIDMSNLGEHLVPDEGAAEQALNVGMTRSGAIGDSLQ